MYGESDFDSNEERLRKRIRNAFGQSGRSLSDAAMRRIEDEVLALMEAYFRAPVQKREAVFEEREAQLLNTISALGRDHPPKRSSSNASEG